MADCCEKGSKTAGDDVEDAAADIIEAIRQKDVMGLGLALRRAFEACAADSEPRPSAKKGRY